MTITRYNLKRRILDRRLAALNSAKHRAYTLTDAIALDRRLQRLRKATLIFLARGFEIAE